MELRLTSTRPYILRAVYEWIEDNKLTAYILVNALVQDVVVPQQFVKNGRIVLNISSIAVRGLDISNEAVRFTARFDSIPSNVDVPIDSVLAIYAKENGKGAYFEQDGDIQPPPPVPPKKAKKPTLKLVK